MFERRPAWLLGDVFVAVLLLSGLCTPSLALTSEEQTALIHMIAAWPVLDSANGGDWNPADIVNACSGTAWTGILCNPNDHVEVLQFSQPLNGPIPDSIGSLAWLTQFSASSCSLRGTIPDTIGNLTLLTELDLADNTLEGSVPSSLNNLTDLDTLHLQNNRLNSSFPSLPALSVLADINLANNKFSGNLPLNATNQPNLELFNARDNQFTGSLPVFSTLQWLEALDVSNNMLSGTIPTIGTHVATVLAGSNQFTHVANSFFSGSTVATLDLSNNLLFYGIDSISFNGNTYLEELRLSGNRIVGSVPAFTGSTHVTRVYLNNNTFSGSIPSSYTALADLVELDVSNNRLTGSIPAFTDTTLELLDLANNQLSGSIPSSLGGLSNLEKLYLSNNTLNGTVPSNLNSSSLSFIYLDRNNFHGRLPFWNFTISFIDLSNNIFDFCDTPYLIQALNCKISQQRSLSCGCNGASFYSGCERDSILTICPPPSVPSSPPVSPPTIPPVAPPVQTPVIVPETPPAAPTAPVGGCQSPSKPGFVCYAGVWTHYGSYNATSDMVFEEDVYIGGSSDDVADFQSGHTQFYGEVRVDGSVHVRAGANISFHNLPISTKRNLAEPRIRMTGCMTLNGGYTLYFSAADLDELNGKSVTLAAATCGGIAKIFVNIPENECRDVIHTISVSDAGGTYLTRAAFVVDGARCVTTQIDLPPPPAKKGLPWWGGLLIAIIIITILAIAIVLVVLLVPSARSKFHSIFTSSPQNPHPPGHMDEDYDAPVGSSSSVGMVAVSAPAAAASGAIVALEPEFESPRDHDQGSAESSSDDASSSSESSGSEDADD